MVEHTPSDYYEGLVESAPDAILVVDERGVIELVNRQGELLFGYPRTELIGQPVEVLVPDRHKGIHPSHRAKYFADPRTRPMGAGLDLTAQRKDGTEVPVDISLSPLRTDRGLVISVAIRDVTERKRDEKALQDAYQRLSSSVRELERHDRDMTLANEMGDLLQICLSSQDAYQVISRFGAQLFSEDAGAVFAPTGSDTLLEVAAGWGDLSRISAVIVRDQCWALRRGRPYAAASSDDGPRCAHLDGPLGGGYVCVPMIAQGETFGVLHVLLAEEGQGEAGSTLEYKQRLAMTVAEQLSLALANLSLRESLRQQSVSDSVTGLFNRRYMEDELSREIARARRAGSPVGLVLADVDNFKLVNDELGHEAGDEVLRSVARALEGGVRTEDVVCRYGGDEFVIVLPGATLEVACERAEQLRRAVTGIGHREKGSQFSVTLSLGVAVFPEHGGSTETLMRAADAALYRAKEAGRDNVVPARARLEPAAPARR